MSEDFIKTAYHESGHIVMAYFNKYICVETEILGNGDGKSTLDYGNNLLMITAITNYKNNPEIFNSLPQNLKFKSAEIAFKAALVLIAGSISEAIYLNDGLDKEEIDVEISGPDLYRVENIDFLLSKIKKNHKNDFISSMMRTAMVILKDEISWTAITLIAHAIHENPRKKLLRSEIQTILRDCGFLDYLANNS